MSCLVLTSRRCAQRLGCWRCGSGACASHRWLNNRHLLACSSCLLRPAVHSRQTLPQGPEPICLCRGCCCCIVLVLMPGWLELSSVQAPAALAPTQGPLQKLQVHLLSDRALAPCRSTSKRQRRRCCIRRRRTRPKACICSEEAGGGYACVLGGGYEACLCAAWLVGPCGTLYNITAFAASVKMCVPVD